MGINLEHELVRNKRRELSEMDLFTMRKVDEYNKIDGVDILNRLGMYKDNMEAVDDIKAKDVNILNYDPERVFTPDDVRRLCARYGLRCLPANLFNGEVDSELPKKIADFESKYGQLNTYHGTHAYICAPPSSFHLQSRPKDPLFFVRVTRGKSENYILLHKWGKDISKWRYISNIWRRSILNIFLTALMVSLIIAYSFAAQSYHFDGDASIFGVSTLAGFGGAIGIFFMIALVFDGLDISNNEKWDSEFR